MLSKQWHPDRNPDGKAQFQAIVAAYETLSNPEMRRRYDAGQGYHEGTTDQEAGEVQEDKRQARENDQEEEDQREEEGEKESEEQAERGEEGEKGTEEQREEETPRSKRQRRTATDSPLSGTQGRSSHKGPRNDAADQPSPMRDTRKRAAASRQEESEDENEESDPFNNTSLQDLIDPEQQQTDASGVYQELAKWQPAQEADRGGGRWWTSDIKACSFIKTQLEEQAKGTLMDRDDFVNAALGLGSSHCPFFGFLSETANVRKLVNDILLPAEADWDGDREGNVDARKLLELTASLAKLVTADAKKKFWFDMSVRQWPKQGKGRTTATAGVCTSFGKYKDRVAPTIKLADFTLNGPLDMSQAYKVLRNEVLTQLERQAFVQGIQRQVDILPARSASALSRFPLYDMATIRAQKFEDGEQYQENVIRPHTHVTSCTNLCCVCDRPLR